jgi:Delta7-sterol 5-desaturase
MSPFLPHLSNAIVSALYGFNHRYSGFNTVKHHDMHHRFPSKHFSLYFTHWDRVCGTLHPTYREYVVPYFTPASK